MRLGRKTKVMVKHLVPGDIAVIDHLDIDRVSAEELITAGAAAVLNCRASTSGSYPNLGPQLLVEAGVLLVDLPDDALFGVLSEGAPITRARRGDVRTGRSGPRGGARRSPRSGARARGDRGAPPRGGGGAGALRAQHHRAHARGARAAGGQDRDAALRHRLPRPARAGRRARRGPPARPARAAALHPRRAAGDRGGRRRRRGGARGRS